MAKLACVWCGNDGPEVSSLLSEYKYGVYTCPGCIQREPEDWPDDIDENPEEKL